MKIWTKTEEMNPQKQGEGCFEMSVHTHLTDCTASVPKDSTLQQKE
jgi:hypothetical protein